MVRPALEPGMKGWVLFDRNCGICTKIANRWRESLRRKGFLLEPLQSAWVPVEFGLTPADTEREFRLLLADGTKMSGADVYRYLLSFYALGRPISIVAGIPPFKQIFNLAYGLIRDNRGVFSKVCGISHAK